MEKIGIIDECVHTQQQEVRLLQHIGGGRYGSVTGGFQCVNFRKFYVLPGFGARLTKTGIALRLHEWSRLKDAVGNIKQNYPNVAAAELRWTRAHHFKQEGPLARGNVTHSVTECLYKVK